MSVHKEHLKKENVKEFLNKAVIEIKYEPLEHPNLSFKQKFLELSDPGHVGKWFCPLKLQGIINTFPPVWNFKPSHYSFKYLDDLKFELYLTGMILDKGSVDYYLGVVKVLSGKKENGFVSVICV